MRTAKTVSTALLAGIGIGFSLNAIADEEPLATDRPDFVESSNVVGKGRYQIETGVSFERDKIGDGSVRTFTTPTLVRIGVSDVLELRVETDGYTRVNDNVTDEKTTGVSDIALGAKWHFADGGGYAPAMAMLIHVDVDSGSEEFRGDGLRPSLRVVAEWELPHDISLGVMPGVVFDKNEEHRFVSGIFAVTMGVPIANNLRMFGEVSGQTIAHTEDGGCIITADLGATYLINNDVQIDTAVSRGINDNTPEWSVGAGFSVRF
jgi:Putative MetA-pathway of phenol degradation